MTDLTNRKPILCLDFDGVCHSYTSGWKGADVIPDPPVRGLFEFLTEAEQYFEINIFSSRTHQKGGKVAMREWFIVWLMKYYSHGGLNIPGDRELAESQIDKFLRFPEDKPPAVVTLDDRGILFTGEWPSIESLRTFKPWYQKGKAGAV